jgi:hypothetical protein
MQLVEVGRVFRQKLDTYVRRTAKARGATYTKDDIDGTHCPHHRTIVLVLQRAAGCPGCMASLRLPTATTLISEMTPPLPCMRLPLTQ